MERAMHRAARRLSRARDQQAAAAWLGLARATRYQKGRRDDTLDALAQALRIHRANADAWCELIDFASAAPHTGTLLQLFALIPAQARPEPARQLLRLSKGQDRLGHMSPAAGQRLRAGMLDLATREGDSATAALLSGRRSGR